MLAGWVGEKTTASDDSASIALPLLKKLAETVIKRTINKKCIKYK